MPRLAIHPVGNFVVAKALERADVNQLATAYEELQDVWEKMISMFLRPFTQCKNGIDA